MRFTLGLLTIVITGVLFAQAQSELLLKQDRNRAPAQHLLASELATLGDPFFLLVLKDHAATTDPAAVMNLIQPDAAKRRVFVVDEHIASAERRGARRVVIAFSGTNQGQVLDTNVMISTFLTPQRLPAGPELEVWGWDNQRGRYNYYKLDDSGTPDRRLVWKFRGASDNADLLSTADRADTCMACHINGGPIMKELLLPWNNWHSSSALANYLQTTAGPTQWPVAQQLRGVLGRAEDLETLIIPAITQFTTRRINNTLGRRDQDGSIETDANGIARVLEGKRLLRHLFVTTEFNLASSRTLSGQHPFATAPQQGPAGVVTIPATFFLNANLISGGGFLQYEGLGVREAQEFGTIAQLTPAEYRTLVQGSRVQLGGKDGDANFAWFTPEPSHIDNVMVDRLLRRRIITPQFVAAALAVDLETPILSSDRERLLAAIPERFQFTTNAPAAHPDDLTRQVMAHLHAQSPAPGTPEAVFLRLLEDPDPVARLRERVIAYRDRERAQLSTPATRTAALNRLHDSLLRRRAAVLQHERLGVINETQDRLLPLPVNLRQQETHFTIEK